jgi:hypothetical protein
VLGKTPCRLRSSHAPRMSRAPDSRPCLNLKVRMEDHSVASLGQPLAATQRSDAPEPPLKTPPRSTTALELRTELRLVRAGNGEHIHSDSFVSTPSRSSSSAAGPSGWNEAVWTSGADLRLPEERWLHGGGCGLQVVPSTGWSKIQSGRTGACVVI